MCVVFGFESKLEQFYMSPGSLADVSHGLARNQ